MKCWSQDFSFLCRSRLQSCKSLDSWKVSDLLTKPWSSRYTYQARLKVHIVFNIHAYGELVPYHRKPLDMILIWATTDGISDNQARSFVGWSYFLNSSARLFTRKMPVFVDLKIKIVDMFEFWGRFAVRWQMKVARWRSKNWMHIVLSSVTVVSCPQLVFVFAFSLYLYLHFHMYLYLYYSVLRQLNACRCLSFLPLILSPVVSCYIMRIRWFFVASTLCNFCTFFCKFWYFSELFGSFLY